MSETRLYDVVFGVVGNDQSVLLTRVPVWEARQFAMRALDSEAERLTKDYPGERTELVERLRAVRERLLMAELGSIIFGHVEQYDGYTGQRMFIALLPTGTDYRDAGHSPTAAFGRLTGRPLFTSTEAS